MAQCPRCKEDMPLLSKICPVCGYVEEGGEDGMSVGQFVTKLEGTLREIKAVPEPTFAQGMGRLTFIIWPLTALFMLVMALVSEAGLFWILFGIFLILAIIELAKKAGGKSKAAKLDKQFTTLKHDFDHNERLAKQSYGKSREVSALIEEIGDQIKVIEKRRKGLASKNLLVWIILLIIIFGAAGWGVFATGKALNDPTAVENRWDRQIHEYTTSGQSADDTSLERIAIINGLLGDHQTEKAEDFFFKHCMGQLQDYDCAVIIITHYTANGENEAAKAFVDKCTGMRYNSDKGKLKKLV